MEELKRYIFLYSSFDYWNLFYEHKYIYISLTQTLFFLRAKSSGLVTVFGRSLVSLHWSLPVLCFPCGRGGCSQLMMLLKSLGRAPVYFFFVVFLTRSFAVPT